MYKLNSMQSAEALELLQNHLAEDPEFDVVRNHTVENITVPLYARRKKGSQEFLFIYNADVLPRNVEALKTIHEQGRRYANSFFKLPKALRVKIPNILSIFIKSGWLTEEMKLWAQEPTRTMVGGEYHSVFFIDVENPAVYGQGISKAFVETGTGVTLEFEFRKIDPQNRSHYLVATLCKALFGGHEHS